MNKDHSLYYTYHNMKARCYRKAHTSYPYYGGRGIKVCDRWQKSFHNFLEDMGDRPEGHTLDRRETNGDYTPDNCRWADSATQGLNKRNTLMFQGEPLMTFCRKHGLSETKVRHALKKGETRPEMLIAIGRSTGRINLNTALMYEGQIQPRKDVAKLLGVTSYPQFAAYVTKHGFHMPLPPHLFAPKKNRDYPKCSYEYDGKVWTQSALAAELGVGRTTFAAWVYKLGIDRAITKAELYQKSLSI